MNQPNVLLVEDDESIREGLRDLLEMENYTVHATIHGRDALEWLRGATVLPKVILLDLNMPVMSGREFLKALRAEPAPLGTLPVVVMSAVSEPQVEGATTQLRKPVDIQAILDTVQAFFN